MVKAVKLTKTFLKKVYGTYAIDNKNNLFYSGDYIIKSNYVNYENIEESEIKIIEDDKMLNTFNNFKNVVMKEVNLNNFKNIESMINGELTINKDNYFDISRNYKIKDWHGKIIDIKYGIGAEYFDFLIPKLLKANPNLKLYEKACKQEYAQNNVKNYFFVDNGEVIGILAPCITQIA